MFLKVFLNLDTHLSHKHFSLGPSVLWKILKITINIFGYLDHLTVNILFFGEILSSYKVVLQFSFLVLPFIILFQASRLIHDMGFPGFHFYFSSTKQVDMTLIRN